MKELAAAVEEKEPGALSYAYFLNEETKKIIVIEKWDSASLTLDVEESDVQSSYKDLEAVKAHRQTEHMAEAMKRSAENLEEPPKIMVLKPLGGFKRS
jgi:quinol monooxygenase YgiN